MFSGSRMLTRIRRLLAAPVFEDEEKTRTAKLLNAILLILAALTPVLLSILSFPISALTAFDLLIGGVMIAVVAGTQWLMRRGHVRTASVLLSCALLAMITSTIYIFGGIRDPASAAYFLVIAVAALLLGGRAAVTFGLLSILATLGVFYAETRGAIILLMPVSVGIRDWIILSGILCIGTLLLRFAVRSIAEGFERTRSHAQALADSNRELHASGDALGARARELTEERNFISAVLDTADALVVVLDPEGHIVRFNRACERTTGYTFDEVKGKHIWDLFLLPESVEPVKGVFQQLCTSKRLNEYEDYWVTKGGDHRRITWSNSVLLNDEGAVEYVIGTGIDITKRKQAEKALRVQHDLAVALSSTSNLTEALNQILEAAWQVEGVDCAAIHLVDGFTGAVDMVVHTGLSPELAEELSHLNASTPQARLIMAGKPTYQQFSEIGLNAKQGVGECDSLRATGIIPVKHEGKIVATLNIASHTCDEFPARTRDVLKAIAALIGSVIARVGAEAALRESRQNLQTLFDALDDFLIIVDMDGRIVHFNPVVEERLGYSAAELSGMNILELYPPEWWKEVMAGLENMVAEKTKTTTFTVSIPLMTKDGTQIPIETKGTFGKWGNRDVLFSISRDITERKRAEQSLREGEERYRTTIDAIDDFIQVVDEDLRIVLFNESFRKSIAMSGTGGELTGREITEILPASIVDEARANYRRVLETGQPWHIEEEIQAGPHTMLMEIRIIPILNEDGRAYRVITIMRDITERKRAEEQLQRYAAELEQANADVVRASEDIARASEEIKQFAYIVSHDLRAPLVNLKGFAAELRDGLEIMEPAMDAGLPHLDEAQRRATSLALHEDVPEALEFIDASVERMDRFINAVLMLSRMGRRELKLEPVDIDAVVRATLDSLAHQLEARHVAVTVGPLPQVIADRTSMEQIVGNILGNAVKYLDPERPGKLEISAERNHDATVFRVRDNGRGIAEKDMDKVFAPFRRVGKQDVPGEGMGLPYVQALVRRHGGRIWCESKLGIGTTIIFTISNHLSEGGDDA